MENHNHYKFCKKCGNQLPAQQLLTGITKEYSLIWKNYANAVLNPENLGEAIVMPLSVLLIPHILLLPFWLVLSYLFQRTPIIFNSLVMAITLFSFLVAIALPFYYRHKSKSRVQRRTS